MSNNILILGGTGKTGKRIAERLSKLNMPIRIAPGRQYLRSIGTNQVHGGLRWKECK